MTGYELAEALYLVPTPGGAYHAVSSPGDDPIRRLLVALLHHDVSPRAEVAQLCSWLGVPEPQDALALVHSAQTLGWIAGLTEPQSVGRDGVGSELTQLLPELSSVRAGLLVDWNGLALASCGMDDDLAATLGALGADLIAVQERHSARLAVQLGLATHGWAAVDAYGSSRVGAWPLYVGSTRLMLIVLGEPRFDRDAFLELVWLLVTRYG